MSTFVGPVVSLQASALGTGAALVPVLLPDLQAGQGLALGPAVTTQVLPGAAANTPPVADDDEYSTRPGQTLNVPAPGFLDGDTDADGDPVIATLITDGVDHGTLTAFPDGRFTYTSVAGFVGIDSFSYQISDGRGGTDIGTVTINLVNTNPVADDDSYSARPGQALNVPAPGFLDGDTDADGDPVFATLITDGVDHGTLTAFPDGRFTYASVAGFVGVDSFSYQISDGFGGVDIGTVTINLINTNPVADDDSYSARPGQALNVPAPGFLDGDTDADGDPVIATLITDGVDHGTLTAFPDGRFTYTSVAGFVGVDSFSYQISDGFGGTAVGTVSIDVVNRAPVADDDVYVTAPNAVLNVLAPGFLDGDTDADGDPVIATLIADGVDHGTLTAFPDGRFTYTPNAGFVGVDSFSYQISDGFGGSDTGLVTIHVTNDPVFETVRIGDAPVRQTGVGGRWLAAWTDARIDILHKADDSNPAEPWSAVALHGAGSSQLNGGDIYRGDLGVSGTSMASSTVVTELDGRQALRFDLAQPAKRVGMQLAQLFSADDGGLFVESGLLRLLDAAGGLVAEKPFWATSTGGGLLVTLDAPAAFVAVELIAGAFNAGTFVYGGYSNPDGSFGSPPFADASGALHGSEFMLDWIEFDVALAGLPSPP